jgi:hypothetical protein
MKKENDNVVEVLKKNQNDLDPDISIYQIRDNTYLPKFNS